MVLKDGTLSLLHLDLLSEGYALLPYGNLNGDYEIPLSITVPFIRNLSIWVLKDPTMRTVLMSLVDVRNGEDM